MGLTDEIGLVEAAYELTTDDARWAQQVCDLLTGHLGADLGAIAARFRPGTETEPRFVQGLLFAGIPQSLRAPLQDAVDAFSGLNIPELGFDNQLWHHCEGYPKTHWFRRRFEAYLVRSGVHDSFSFIPSTSPGHCVSFTVLSSHQAKLSSATRHRFRRLSPHLSAAMRLRWGADWKSLPETRIDAVFRPDGRCTHLTSGAPCASILDRLSAAVKDRERARGPLRRKLPDEALSLWTALVGGRWSLVDRLEADGKRFVLAVRNEDGVTDPRALHEREVQVVALAGNGATNAEIACELGLSEGAVCARLHSACRKLKCRGRRDLIRLIGPRTQELMLEVDGVRLGVLAEIESPHRHTTQLTGAEKGVLEALRRGLSNAEISHSRGVSRNTVAKQVAAILRKTGRYSRFELMLD
ncbi:MAG: LuxR C-terminal-related transcriptional regulator [Myxococcales bacterium]|nr:LuxR C-terminal-related transcriptional regulator [Myxococcales bacterium]